MKKKGSDNPFNMNEESKKILERISDPFLALDKNFCFIYMNTKAGEIFKRDQKKIIGKHIWTEFPEVVGKPFYNAYLKAMQNQEYIYLEEYYFNSNQWFENHIYPSDEGLTIYFRDITDRKKLEAKLFKSNEIKDIVLNRISDSVVSVDNEWRYTFLNNAALDTHPNDRLDTIGQVIWDVHPEMHGTIFWDKYHEAMETKNVVEIESFYDPMKIWFLVKVYPSVDGLTIFYKNITDRKKIEEELREKGNFIGSIINSSPDIIYIYDIEERKNIYVNEGIQKNLGYTDQEIKAMGDQIIPTLMHPDDFQFYLNNTFPRYAKAKDKELIEHEFRMRDKEGNWHWLYCKESIFLRDQNGNPKQIFGITTDITEHKKKEDLIKTNEQQLQFIYDTTSNAIFLLQCLNEGQYKFISVNKAFLTATGLTKDQILNKNVQDIIPQPSLNLVLKKYKEAIQNKTQIQWEEETPYPTGTKVGIVNITPIFDERGECTQLLGTVHDITALKNAEDEMQSMNDQLRNLYLHLENIREEERTTIAREIHDELGQQLTGLKMDVSWIGKKISGEDKTIQEKLKSMTALIDDTVKTVRRIATELRPGILDDLGLIAAIEWQSQEFEKRNGIKSEFETKLHEVDPEKKLATNIFRVYQEALTNVIRHAKATSVKTSLEEKKGYLILTIADNGIGFDQNELKNSNLGLIGMKERALLFKGELSVKSEKSKGTVITLKVPLKN